MQLFITQTSPYVRQCRIVARERHVNLTETQIGPTPTEDAAYLAVNPAGHGPALAVGDGRTVLGAPMICAFLDSLAGKPELCDPADWAGRRQQALADAATGFLVAMRGGATPPPVAAGWEDGLTRVLDALEAMEPSVFGIGQIATVVMLSYADFRHPGLDWRTGRPELEALQTALEARPSFRDTAPG